MNEENYLEHEDMTVVRAFNKGFEVCAEAIIDILESVTQDIKPQEVANIIRSVVFSPDEPTS